MMTQSLDDNFSALHVTKDIFLGRQAILNRDQKLVAYELMLPNTAFRASGANADSAPEAASLVSAIEPELRNLLGASHWFVNVEAPLLMSDSINVFSRDNFVLEISEAVVSIQETADRVAHLMRSGFVFALHKITSNIVDIHKLLPLAELVKINILEINDQTQLTRICDFYKQMGKRLVAENVDTIEQFQRCLDCGFDHFQGGFFAKASVFTGSKLSPSELAIIHLMDLINSDSDNADIESQIKRDVTIGLNLLRLVNTPAAGVPHRIGSIRQALLILGRRQLQRWLQILLYTKPGKNGGAAPTQPLLILASTRGKLLELIAQKLRPGNHNMADMGFTIGIMSLMDCLFNLPMEEILSQIAVVDDVSDALLYRKGFFGELLVLAEQMERLKEGDGQRALSILNSCNLSLENFNRLQMLAFEWADQISRAAA